jgi:hypothetical protein
MAIDNIKPPGAYRPLDLDAETTTASKPGKRFANGESEVHAAEVAGDTPRPFGVAAQFSRAALQDPAKLDSMVRAFASDLIDSGQGVTGALSGADRESLLDFVSRDPLVRHQIETYLQKVLV